MNKVVFLSIFIASIFSGCSIKDVSKPIIKYTIEDDTQVKKEAIAIDKVLKISALKSPKYIQNNGIWYKNSSYETNSYIYSRWDEDFVNLIERNIASSVYDSGLFRSIFRRYSKVQQDLLLEGEIIDARQIISNKGSADISFKIRLYLIDSNNSKLVSSNEFQYLEKCESVDAKGAIVAYNNVVKNLNKDVVLWLKKSVKEN